MEKMKQIAVQAPNKPGVLSKICEKLAEHEVNIVAILAPESLGTGILRLIPDEMEKAEDVFNELQYSFTTENVFSLRLKNKPGQLAQVTGRLFKANIGVEFLYADLRKRYSDSRHITKPMDLYRQQYCGCVYSEWERYAGTET